MKKNIKRILLGLLGVIIVAIIMNYPKLDIISGFSAKNTSSSVFLAQRSLELTDRTDNNIPLVKLATDKVDKNYSTASVYGLKERKAIYREGLGSLLINDDFDVNQDFLVPKRKFIKTNLPYPYGDLPQKDTVFESINYKKMEQIVGSIFDSIGEEKYKTRAAMVIYKNQIISEKYLDGFDQNSRFLGWSMTKSLISTLYGVLQSQNKINIYSKAPVAEWQNDERREILIHNLLQMNSGLEWDEDYGSISDVTKMLYLDADMTASQKSKEMSHKPNEHWLYSSGTTNLLSGILRTHFGNDQEYLDFPYREFIDKIGMRSMVIETDMSGNFVGSSYGWATARDWGKFGLLYLHKGDWNGEKVFDPSWVNYVTTPSPTSEKDYGGHFWLNAGGFFPDAPKDMYSANGFQGQRVFIIPSRDLVIVRFGLQDGTVVDFNKFISSIVSEIDRTQVK